MRPSRRTASGRLSDVARVILPVLILGSLASFVGFVPHEKWPLPRFFALWGQSPIRVEAWCSEHGVPESICIECDTRRWPKPADAGWCREHGVAECVLHHPELAQTKAPAVVTSDAFARARRGLDLLPRQENNSRCKLYRRRLQFASTEAIEKAGIGIAVAEEEPVLEAATANGEITYDQTRTARLASRIRGTVWRAIRKVGDGVKQGDVLALIDSAEVGRQKGEFLEAIIQSRLKQTVFDRMRATAAAVPERSLMDADAALQEARTRLRVAQQALINLGFAVRLADFDHHSSDQIADQLQFLGLPESVRASLSQSSTSSNLLPLQSPLDGIVVERETAEGEVVDSSKPLFTVTDPTTMWLTLAVRQEDIARVRTGLPVLFRPSDASLGNEIQGTTSWVSTKADHKTRTVQVRVDLRNPDGALRANTFGTGRIVLRYEPHAIVIPSEAMRWDGCCHVVFVRDKDFFKKDAPKFFHVRQIRPGVRSGNATEIIVGLLPGEVVASTNSAELEAELLKGHLGAGCTCCVGK